MKKILTYIPLHFLAWVILGILIQFYTKFWSFGFTNLGLVLGVFLFLLIVANQKVVRTLLSFKTFFFLGVFVMFVQTDYNYKNYYANLITPKSYAVLQIEKVLKTNDYNYKYQAKVTQVDSFKTRGNVLLNVSKDSLQQRLEVDDLIYTKANFVPISNSKNLYQFNYKFYLEKQDVFEQVFLKRSEFRKLLQKEFSLIGLSSKFREKVKKSLENYNFSTNELAVIYALLLGERQDISKELTDNYAKAGAIHILAVSGLHVGIILLILSFIFKPVEKLKNGKFLKTLFIVFFLWAFAFVAGLSASVVRAVTMFTFLAVGMSFNRKNVVLFSLISSMFFLLIFKPLFLFDVGFQLSYLAVFGIVLTQPKIYKVWQPKNKIIDKFWQLTTVSISAQLGVLPLSLFYFHQFPGLFMLSNLVIIPFLGAILMGGIVIISFALLGVLPQFLANIYAGIISLMNAFVNWISKQEEFLFTELSMSFLLMLASYLFIFLGVSFFVKQSSKKLLYVLLSVIVLQGVFLFEDYQRKSTKEFIVFHKSRNSILGNRIGEEFFLYHDLDSSQIKDLTTISSYKVNQNVIPNYKIGVPNVLRFENETILVVDSLGVYQLKNLNQPIVVLQQSPKINLERLIKTIKPKQIIADGSNYKSYVKRWSNTAKELKVSFYSTNTKGAFVFKN